MLPACHVSPCYQLASVKPRATSCHCLPRATCCHCLPTPAAPKSFQPYSTFVCTSNIDFKELHYNVQYQRPLARRLGEPVYWSPRRRAKVSPGRCVPPLQFFACFSLPSPAATCHHLLPHPTLTHQSHTTPHPTTTRTTHFPTVGLETMFLK